MSESESERTERVLQEVRVLAEQGQADEALRILKSVNGDDPVLMNAAGVCHLRAGRPAQAVQVFHRLCVGEGVGLRSAVPPLHIANFATALLLSGNLHGCIYHLRYVDRSHPVSAQLHAAIANWERSLGGWRRLLRRLGMYEPERPLELDTPPGAFR